MYSVQGVASLTVRTIYNTTLLHPFGATIRCSSSILFTKGSYVQFAIHDCKYVQQKPPVMLLHIYHSSVVSLRDTMAFAYNQVECIVSKVVLYLRQYISA